MEDHDIYSITPSPPLRPLTPDEVRNETACPVCSSELTHRELPGRRGAWHQAKCTHCGSSGQVRVAVEH